MKKKNTRGNLTPKSTPPHPWKHSHTAVISMCLIPGMSCIFQSKGFALCFKRILLHLAAKVNEGREWIAVVETLGEPHKSLLPSWTGYHKRLMPVVVLSLILLCFQLWNHSAPAFVFIDLWKLPLWCIYSFGLGLVLPKMTLIDCSITFPLPPVMFFLGLIQRLICFPFS